MHAHTAESTIQAGVRWSTRIITGFTISSSTLRRTWARVVTIRCLQIKRIASFSPFITELYVQRVHSCYMCIPYNIILYTCMPKSKCACHWLLPKVYMSCSTIGYIKKNSFLLHTSHCLRIFTSSCLNTVLVFKFHAVSWNDTIVNNIDSLHACIILYPSML